jgi:hypothetical protein
MKESSKQVGKETTECSKKGKRQEEEMEDK